MGRLVDDLMLLARSETDDIRFELEALDLSGIAAEAVREARVLGQGRGVAIRTEFEALALVEGDRKRTKQLLMIVLDNAVKYSRRNAEVMMRTRAESGFVVLAVRNSGAALYETELPHVFERFHRGRDATVQDSTGSGLGLAIARWIAEKQGAAISLARTEGEGVEVAVRFPVYAAAPAGVVPDIADREAAE
jgi:signal transduction histidine kinase